MDRIKIEKFSYNKYGNFEYYVSIKIIKDNDEQKIVYDTVNRFYSIDEINSKLLSCVNISSSNRIIRRMIL